jgi:hypothetical protein
MTQDMARKDAIRQRMTATGESATWPRRALEGAGPAGGDSGPSRLRRGASGSGMASVLVSTDLVGAGGSRVIPLADAPGEAKPTRPYG